MNWNQARAFQATAETGSLSAAARKLNLTQPTLSRQVSSLEEALGIVLFERIGKRLQLTEAGRAMLDHANKMEQAANEFMLAATGRSQTVEGIVSISTIDAFAVHYMPRIMERIQKEAPGIVVHIIVSNMFSDLQRREADIAIRHVRPQEPELIGKLIRETSAGFYASRSWVEKNGYPDANADVGEIKIIGSDRQLLFFEYIRGLGLNIDERNVPLICDNSDVVAEFVRRGLGIGMLINEVADKIPDLEVVLDELPEIKFPIWLVTHRELHTSRKIRIVYDILAEELARPLEGEDDS